MNQTSQPSSPNSTSDTDGPITFEKVLLLFKETDRKFQETQKAMAEASLETDKKFKETQKALVESAKETDRMLKETSKEITRVERQFTSMWGKFVESLVSGDLIRLLNERGIKAHRTQQRVEGFFGDTNYEFDIIAVNGEEIVIVEVKTTLKSKDIEHFLQKLNNVRMWLPEFKDKRIYGAVAYIHTEDNVLAHAKNCGLLIIRATGKSASIINDIKFQPKNF